MELNPFKALRDAKKENPKAVKAAYGVIAFAAAGAVTIALFGGSLGASIAVLGTMIVFTVLVGLVIKGDSLPAKVLTWGVLALALLSITLSVFCVFFKWPRPWPPIGSQAEDSEPSSTSAPGVTPSARTADLPATDVTPISADVDLAKLISAETPRFAVRIVRLGPEEKLGARLGRDSQSYVMVGDYATVAGESFARACQVLGMDPSVGEVTVFQVAPNGKALHLRPANWRAALKIAEDMEQLESSVKGSLRGFGSSGPAAHALEAWATKGGAAAHRKAYMRLSNEFTERELGIDEDWRGLGYAESLVPRLARLPSDASPEVRSLFGAKPIKFGARAFFVRNVPRKDLSNYVTWRVKSADEILPKNPFAKAASSERK